MSDGWAFRPSAAIFDCDGLLVDTHGCWEIAYRAAAADAGTPLSSERLTSLGAALNGASVELAAERLSQALGSAVRADFLRQALIDAVEAEAQPAMPGASRLLDLLEGRMPLAVASNGPAAVIDAALRGAGLRERFSHVVSGEEVSAPKPDPAVYLEACRRLAVDPHTAVAFEDSPLGASAASAAGIFLVGVPSAPTAEFEAELRATVLDDPGILAALSVSPAKGAPIRRGTVTPRKFGRTSNGALRDC